MNNYSTNIIFFMIVKNIEILMFFMSDFVVKLNRDVKTISFGLVYHPKVLTLNLDIESFNGWHFIIYEKYTKYICRTITINLL